MDSQVQLIENGLVVTMNDARDVICNGTVVVRDTTVLDVGPNGAMRDRYGSAQCFDARGCLLIPGLIDAHNHSAHFLAKGWLDDWPTEPRWRTRLYPFEQALTEDDAYWGALGTFIEMLKTGTTAFCDPGSRFPLAVVRAAADVGIRGTVAPVIADQLDAARPVEVPDGRSRVDALLHRCEALYDEANGSANGRVRVQFGLWNANSVSDDLGRRVRALAEKFGTVIHAHVATREADNTLSMQKHGMRIVERYHQLGLLDERLVGAHMGAINAHEVTRVADSGMTVVHCPSASMLGAFGCIAHGRFPELVLADTFIALGSDAASISRFLDMVRIAQLAACAHKDVRMDATVIGATRAFEMATHGGARALGLLGRVGVIQPGATADLVLVRIDGWEWQPWPYRDPIANLVYSSSGQAVDSVMVDGEWVLLGKKSTRIDETEVLKTIAAHAREACGRSGMEDASWRQVAPDA